MQKLTQRQEMVLQYIESSIAQRGYPPTLREIGNFMGIHSTNGVNESYSCAQSMSAGPIPACR